MSNIKIAAASIVTAALAWGCIERPPAEPAIDLAAEAQAVRDRSAEWMALATARDAAAIATGFFTTDAVTLFDGDIQHGTAEIQADLEADMAANPDSTLSWQTSQVRVAASGDMAHELGSFTFDPDGAGEASAVSGEYSTVWLKGSDGIWRAAADAGTTRKASGEDTT